MALVVSQPSAGALAITRELRSDAFLKEDKTSPISIFQMIGASNGYTDFAAIDIDKECESVYAQHHRLNNLANLYSATQRMQEAEEAYGEAFVMVFNHVHSGGAVEIAICPDCSA